MSLPLSPPTELIHLSYDGNFLLECDATILSCRVITTSECDSNKNNSNGKNNENNKNKNNEQPLLYNQVELQLDRTVMHPQGGGQPTDTGVIEVMMDNGTTMAVVGITKVTIDRASGIVTHVGNDANSSSSGSGLNNGGADLSLQQQQHLQVGQSIRVRVDPVQRRILSECHTAGHVVDSAMAQCDRILPPVKGYHFLDGPYVEYKGVIPPEERDELLANLQRAFADLVEQDIATRIETMTKTDAMELCRRVQHQQQDTINMDDFGDEVRMVTVAGWSCPCGGTHVRSTLDLQERKWGIVGIKSKKGVVRIRYDQNAPVVGPRQQT